MTTIYSIDILIPFFQFYDDLKGLLSAFNLSIFPLFYFFSFLYYTDVGSTFLVLLMYSLHLDRHDWLASFIGNSFFFVINSSHSKHNPVVLNKRQAHELKM
jgi:alpha-1,2-glucosyltransferase